MERGLSSKSTFFSHHPTCRLAVVKIASRCNLNCTYCYMYNLGDQTALQQPKVMSIAVIEASVARCMTHAATRGLESFRFVFHGGEPLMAGRETFHTLIASASRWQDQLGVIPEFSVQTNATLLNDAWCTALADWGVSVGVSLDGPKSVNDRHRITHKNEGSYDKTITGWNRAKVHGLRPGVLTVIDPSTSADEAYHHLRALGPESVDFLLPDANYMRPPSYKTDGTPYADWLLRVFELWNCEPIRPFRVRTFEQIMSTTLGIAYATDALGEGENEIVVIETDGEIGPVDTLRAAVPGVSRTGFNVLRNSVDEALDHPILSKYHGANQSLCETCTTCPISRICGGGYLSHRYSPERIFDNPSVYCRDLTKLIAEIRQSVIMTLPKNVLKEANLRPWSSADIEAARAVVKK
ncbi:radical SAM protein [uncultured Tateyamaria sp.]|uniref:radical SAM protein n=1 Tax=uncultured Tateyamaria sp. TaxID=455651 RepID=UPI0026249410|nr:radical SAM protein [uncultured Tateyamaria sp.]